MGGGVLLCTVGIDSKSKHVSYVMPNMPKQVTRRNETRGKVALEDDAIRIGGRGPPL